MYYLYATGLLFLFFTGIGIQTFYNPSGLTWQMSDSYTHRARALQAPPHPRAFHSPEDEDLSEGSTGETASKAATSRTDTSQEPPHGNASHASTPQIPP